MRYVATFEHGRQQWCVQTVEQGPSPIVAWCESETDAKSTAKRLSIIPKPVDDFNYFAKATFPAGNTWRTCWTTRANAVRQAEQFCADWREVGIVAEAAVFYRDGSAVQHFKRS